MAGAERLRARWIGCRPSCELQVTATTRTAHRQPLSLCIESTSLAAPPNPIFTFRSLGPAETSREHASGAARSADVAEPQASNASESGLADRHGFYTAPTPVGSNARRGLRPAPCTLHEPAKPFQNAHCTGACVRPWRDATAGQQRCEFFLSSKGEPIVVRWHLLATRRSAVLCCAVLTSRVLLRLSTSRIRISSLRVDQSTHRSTLRSVSLETAGCRCMLNHCRNDRGRTTRDEQCECGEDARGWRRAPRAERG